jgi:hypothetical protein
MHALGWNDNYVPIGYLASPAMNWPTPLAALSRKGPP